MFLYRRWWVWCGYLVLLAPSEWVRRWVLCFLGRGGGVAGSPGYSRVHTKASYPGFVTTAVSMEERRPESAVARPTSPRGL